MARSVRAGCSKVARKCRARSERCGFGSVSNAFWSRSNKAASPFCAAMTSAEVDRVGSTESGFANDRAASSFAAAMVAGSLPMPPTTAKRSARRWAASGCSPGRGSPSLSSSGLYVARTQAANASRPAPSASRRASMERKSANTEPVTSALGSACVAAARSSQPPMLPLPDRTSAHPSPSRLMRSLGVNAVSIPAASLPWSSGGYWVR